jgi:glycosyltransferase involved in cell wall biosynthesis
VIVVPRDDTPTFSVVMPAYNAERTIGPAIASVFAQSRGDFELIVVDDGSRDGTLERVREFEADARLHLLRRANEGPGAARNAGIRHARGRYVSFLDSDDLWLPRYLEVMQDCLARDPDAGFAYTDGWVLDDRIRRIRRTTAMSSAAPPMPPPSDPREFFLMLLERNFVANAVTVRRTLLTELGGYNPQLRAAQDWELWLRLVAHGHRAIRAPGLLFVWRDRADSVSSSALRLAKYRREVYRLVADEYPVTEDVRELARARMRECDARAADLAGTDPRRRLRPWVGRVRRRLWWWWWYSVPPQEVAEPFPDLTAL